jgi:hypothetical protein
VPVEILGLVWNHRHPLASADEGGPPIIHIAEPRYPVGLSALKQGEDPFSLSFMMYTSDCLKCSVWIRFARFPRKEDEKTERGWISYRSRLNPISRWFLLRSWERDKDLSKILDKCINGDTFSHS